MTMSKSVMPRRRIASLPAGVLPDRLLGGHELLEHDRRLDTGQFPPQPHLPGR
jgi:hypothetical protein